MALAWGFDDDDDDAAWWAAIMAATVVDTIPATLLERFEARRPGWHRRAACRGSVVDFFSADPAQIEAAAALCATCPVRGDCEAAGKREPAGVWGGVARGFLPKAETPWPRRRVKPRVDRLAAYTDCAAVTAIYAVGCCNRCYQRRRRREAKRAS